MSWCNVLQRAGSDFCETYNFPGTFAYFQFMIFTQERILTIKENFPSYTLIVILFLKQEVEIKSLQPEMRPHPIRIQFLHPYKIFQSGKGGSESPYLHCSRNRTTIKVQLGKFSLIVKILFLQQSVFERTLHQIFHRCN